MEAKLEKIEVNGVSYIREDAATPALAVDKGLPYVIIRSRDSGCHAGHLKSREGANVVLVNARRLWYWSGASTLSQLAMEGVKNPGDCKFPCEVSQIEVIGVCEIIPTTEVAMRSIKGVPIWKQ